jgi:hypothetical protein
MTADRNSHIKVSYTDGGVEITRIYAVSDEISRALGWKKDWLGRKPTGRVLWAWLGQQGCHLDCSDGPASVRHYPDGSSWEGHYRDGEAHREVGPAIVRRFADGSTEEYYYRNGKLYREGGPAVVLRTAGGSQGETC